MAVFRVSEVESFRQWREDEEAELDTFLNRMRGLEPPSKAMEAGTAFHLALELSPTSIEVAEIAADGYTFRFNGEFQLALPNIREVRASKTYQTPDGPVIVTGKLDIIEGKRIEDHKTTSRFDPERYLGGYQWRYYLDIFNADVFRWNVFEIAPTDDPFFYFVDDHHTLEQYRYPSMGTDCQRLVEDLARFARVNLPERFREREALAA